MGGLKTTVSEVRKRKGSPQRRLRDKRRNFSKIVSQKSNCSGKVNSATAPSTAATTNEVRTLSIHFVNVEVTVDLDNGSTYGW